MVFIFRIRTRFTTDESGRRERCGSRGPRYDFSPDSILVFEVKVMKVIGVMERKEI
jgi:hypothetical protein